MLRAKEHLFFKERKQTDFAKPRRSEQALFNRQATHYENSANNLQAEVDQMDQDQKFDRNAYNQLKSEIKKRREAKERLLQQGFPELKPYITF